MEKYRQEIEFQLGHDIPKSRARKYSREYQQFKEEILPLHYSMYEKACNFFDKYVKISPDDKKAAEYQKSIDLPCIVIPNEAKATYKNGILDIIIKLKEKKRDSIGYHINID